MGPTTGSKTPEMQELFGQLSDYKVGRPIGRGARSVVYKIKHVPEDALYAGKFVHLREKADRRVMGHLKNENSVLCDLHDASEVPPQIVRRHDFLTFRKFFFLQGACLLLQYVPGASLAAHSDYSLTQKIDIMVDVCHALSYIHSNEYIHADLKPDNIIVTPTGKVKMIDFGFAAPVGTKMKGVKGTTGYLAPEQAGGRLQPATDVYNVGGAMYWLMTGENLPYVSSGSGAAAAASSHAVDPVPPRKLNHDIPADLSDLILQCCSHQMEERPTMSKLESQLHDIALRIRMQA